MEQEKRPGLYEFTSETPEFYRWYEYGGKPREKPLTLEELEQFYRGKGYAQEEAKAAAWSSGARPPLAPAQGIEVKGYEPKEADMGSREGLLSRHEGKEALGKGLAGKVVGQISRPGKEAPVDRLSGELVDHGPAPFEFDQNNPTNYFAKLKNSDGKERLVWGVDLGRALEERDAKRGDRITLENRGKQTVTVERPIQDGQGNKIGFEPVEVQRNAWKVHAQAVREKNPEDLVRDYPGMSHEAATLKLAEKVARRFPAEVDQRRFMGLVKDRVAAKVEQGQPSAQIKVREVHAVREERVLGR